MPNFSPKFPLFFSSYGGYASNTTIKDVVRQNFKNLILTSPGEKIMNPDFGVGVRNFLFEQNTNTTRELIGKRIRNQVDKYMPFIEIQDYDFESEENDMYITIKYFIIPLGETDVLSINTAAR